MKETHRWMRTHSKWNITAQILSGCQIIIITRSFLYNTDNVRTLDVTVTTKQKCRRRECKSFKGTTTGNMLVFIYGVSFCLAATAAAVVFVLSALPVKQLLLICGGMEQQDSSMKVFKTPDTSPEPAQTNNAKTCALEGCEAEGVKPRGGRCSQCLSVSYCSKDHQKRDWARHKETCKRIASLSPRRPPINLKPEIWYPQAVSI